MKILYVEDNLTNVSLVRRVARGHTLISYVDGEDALKHFEQDDPDLVLMDVQLAGKMTGLDVVRKLRADGVKVPIIAVTAYAMLGDRETCLQAGCDDYIAKPLPIPKLVEIIQTRDKAVNEARKADQAEVKETPATVEDVTPVSHKAVTENVEPKSVDTAKQKQPEVTVEKVEDKPESAIPTDEKVKEQTESSTGDESPKSTVQVTDEQITEKPQSEPEPTLELQEETLKVEKQLENSPEVIVQSNNHDTNQ